MKRLTKLTFTKMWVNRILWVCLIDMQLPFVLAFLDKTEIAEALAIAIVTEIVALFSGYMAKSYWETKAEKKQEFDYHVFDIAQNIEPCDGEDDEEE